MSNPEYTHTETTTEINTGTLFFKLWIVLMSLCVLGFILDRHEDKPETRKVHSILEYRGHIVNGHPVSINEHCNGL